MAPYRETPVSACAFGVRWVLGCVAICLTATLASAEVVGYNSWQMNGFTRTALPPTPNSAPVSLLASLLSSSSWAPENIVSASSVDSVVDSSDAIASLSGVVYFDANYNGVRDSGDWAIRDAILSLTSASSDTVLIATTDTDGKYTFAKLAADNYTITLLTQAAAPGVTQEGILTDAAGDPVFTGLGVPVGQSIANIQLGTGYTGVAYDFGQNSYPTNLVSKRMLLNEGSGVNHTDDPPERPTPPVVPEPGTLALLAVAGLCVTGFSRRRRS